jgi:vacuolar protein sorting-associated protein 13A/C
LGLIVKPLTGIFDLTSKTAEGVKATALYWDDKANECRERDIRVMYSQE